MDIPKSREKNVLIFGRRASSTEVAETVHIFHRMARNVQRTFYGIICATDSAAPEIRSKFENAFIANTDFISADRDTILNGFGAGDRRRNQIQVGLFGQRLAQRIAYVPRPEESNVLMTSRRGRARSVLRIVHPTVLGMNAPRKHERLNRGGGNDRPPTCLSAGRCPTADAKGARKL
ncbi:hypothetical protein [Pendulispora albinea]|uniref:Uncharacterized protein n=1 Tax=Pendulispora albinea TaxID=2741071 RepID=A0ABZ2LV99_9BACT